MGRRLPGREESDNAAAGLRAGGTGPLMIASNDDHSHDSTDFIVYHRPEFDAPPRRPNRLDPRPVEIESERDGATLRLRMRNEIVMSNLFPVKERFYRLLNEADKPRLVEFDLRDVGFADSSAVGMFLEFHRALRQMDAGMKIVAISPPLRHIFAVMALDGLFEIAPAREE